MIQMTIGRMAFVCLIAFVSCKNNDEDKEPVDTGTGTDSGSDTETVSDSSSEDTDIETDTGESDIPPELETRCQLGISQTPASEENDWVSEDKGNALDPDIAHNDATLMVWSYRKPQTGAVFKIQTAPYDLSIDGGLPGPDGGQPGPIVEPVADGPDTSRPAMVARGAEFGLIWLDARWDATCDPADVSKCDHQIAFLKVDKSGQSVVSSQPLPVTNGAIVAGKPNLTATSTGYVVVWLEQGTSDVSLKAVSLTADGNPGTPVTISGEDGVSNLVSPSIAALDQAVVVVWGDDRQSQILLRRLDINANPQGEVSVLDEAKSQFKPSVVAANDGFLVAWSSKPYGDFEIFTMKLDSNAQPTGEPKRVTWTTSDAENAMLCWNGTNYGLAWLSAKSFGDVGCAVSSCQPQVFGMLLDADGAAASMPVQLSSDANPALHLNVAWDGSGFTAVYELPRYMRQQVFYSRMVCD